MADFRKPRFGGGNRDGGRGGFGGSRPSFGERKELFQAICSNCNKECQVPFRPNGTKPVFCKDCFVRPEGDAPRNFDRRDDRRERPVFVPQPKAAPDPRVDILIRDVAALTQKVDTAISLLRAQALHDVIQKVTKPKAKVTKKK